MHSISYSSEYLNKAEKVSEAEVKAHVARTSPHRDGGPRDAKMHAATDDRDWVKKRVPIAHLRPHDIGAHSKRDVARYTKKLREGSEAPAIVLHQHHEGPGGYSVEDGRHRLQAAHDAGRTHIDAYVGKWKK
jgi:hypothetical protein